MKVGLVFISLILAFTIAKRISNIDPIFNIWYISDSNGNDQNEGDKEYPFKTVARAIQAAKDGDVLLVGSDTYTGPGNCDVAIDKSVYLRSINGDPKQVIFDCGDAGVAAFHIDAINVTLSAISVQGCSPVGAIKIARGKVNVLTSVFHENTGDNGGTFFVASGAHLSISNSICEYNEAQNGGFAYVSAGAIIKVDKNTRINENRASGSGGAIYLEKNSNAELHDVLMIANEAALNGGAIYSEGTSFDMSNVQFTMNKAKAATAKGGAMYTSGTSELDMDNCQFVSSSSGSDGGAVYVTGTTTIDYDDCSFEGNTAGGNGGAICLDGPQTGISGRSNTLLANWADGNGGGIYVNGGNVIADQDRFISNSADAGASYYLQADASLNSTNAFYGEGMATQSGGGLYLQDSTLWMEKTTISDNAGNKASAGIYCAASKITFIQSYIKENIGSNLFCDHCSVSDKNSECTCATC